VSREPTLKLPPVYAITDRAVSGIASHAEIARRLLAVGVRCVQLREKAMPDRDLLAEADAIAALARERRALALVNDRADVALAAGLGVHLGEEDLPAAAARAILPPTSAIGVSTHSVEEARAAAGDGASDYIAFGPVFESGTKTVRTARGLEALAAAAGTARERGKPLVAIGGIAPERLEEVWDAGADSAAMIAGLLAGGRIEENARRALDAARRRRLAGRVYLVGFMAVGKTSVGRRIAERLGRPFVDVDSEIERTSGRTVRALFEESGEGAFRERESAFLRGTESLPDAVVATGGGAFTFEENRRVISRLGTAVLLDAPLAAVRARLAGKTDRPLFTGPEQLEALFAARTPFYRMAVVRVQLTGSETVDETADRVLIALEDRLEISG
jgi:thiamine-phosphate diphosphorylase